MPESPKFYATIAVSSKQAVSVEYERMHLRLTPERLTGRLSGNLVALQALHVGSGALSPPELLGLDIPDVSLVKAFARNGEQRIIPGSALKGAFRSLVELFTESCVCKTRIRWTGDERARHGECQYRHRALCPACKLFGAMGYQGQVRFEDALQQDGSAILCLVPPQYQPRANRDYRRYYPHALVDSRDPIWPLEAVPVGTRFTLRAQFTNLSEGELGLLLIALGQGEWALCPKVGAGKSSGLGAVRIEELTVERMLADQIYKDYESTAAWTPVDTSECIEAAGSLYLQDVLRTLGRDLADIAIVGVSR